MIDKDSVEANLVNIGALGIGMMSLSKVLTVLVMASALVYNILKIISWFSKWQKEKEEEIVKKSPSVKDVSVKRKKV